MDEDQVHRLVEGHARRAPEAVAVVCGERTLSYGELDSTSARLAGYLRQQGAGKRDVVVVCLDRSVELPAAVLAVLRAGAVYVLLEPSAPDRRLREVLRELDPALVITQESHRIRLADVVEAAIVCVDTDAGAIAAEPEAGQAPEIFGTNPACLVHRGTAIEHRQLALAQRDWAGHYELTPVDRVLQTAPAESVVFTADWIRALCSGATLVLAGRDFGTDRTASIAELAELLDEQRITVLECETHLARRLGDELRERRPGSLRLFAVSGERWFLGEHRELARILGPRVRLVHVHRVPEVVNDLRRLELSMLGAPRFRDDQALLGRPVPGVEIRVVAPGTWQSTTDVGEVAIRIGESPLRRTRDLARLRPDGLLDHLGRADVRATGLNAVAVAEVESALRSFPEVREAVVADDPDFWDEYAGRVRRTAVGYVVPTPGREIDAARLARLHNGHLARVVVVPSLPRDGSGAVDRERLPRAVVPRSRHGETGLTAKGGPRWFGENSLTGIGYGLAIAIALTLASYLLTDVFWPGSRNTERVPQPWAAFFHVLYAAESASFGLGAAYLFRGYRWIASLERGLPLTVAAHLSLAWLLLAWWPQDNFYRLSSPQDWPRQTVLVFTFNITLMVAGAVLVRFVSARRRTEPR
ncbi:AMP-binding protein [Amycolatopsis sp. YIM 10]|uniref:AMP-binding protein n=1 Tax=Amycolatopsis sp. YIM 10 TaxID=2653857 RepID=UPI0012A7E73C|nr:AMP-binding protein [Amycolatopsis sp. YIM 10]QFU91098.1 Linear gramicidin synthase subunit D [Amycolatopsis sp. YIM 10]